MEEIKVTKSNVDAAYAVADENTKKVLDTLFGTNAPQEAATPDPSLDDYTTIRSYEDACKALGISPLLNYATEIYLGEDNDGRGYATTDLPSHIIALLKLETISRALWGKEWEPKPDAEGSNVFWYPWFALWTKSEIENLNDTQRGSLLSRYASSGASCGFGYLSTNRRSSRSHAYIGFRLCQETEEKATYFGTQFIELWAEYLAFNFTTGDRLK